MGRIKTALGHIRAALSDRSVRLISIILAFAFAVAVALTIIGSILSSPQLSDPWLEVAKAGLQLGVIVLVGGAVTYGFKFLESERDARARRLESERDARARQLESERDAQARRDEYLLGVIRNLVESYNRIKSVRRTLRAYGFLKPKAPRPDAHRFTAEQVDAYRKQMFVLMEAQLRLEEISREISAQPQVFEHSEALEVLIHSGESYVNEIIGDWEDHGVDVVIGAHAERTTDVFKHLQNFLGSSSAEVGGIKTLSEPVGEIQRLIQGQFLGAEDTHVPFHKLRIDLEDQGESSKVRKMIGDQFEKDPDVIAYDTKRQQGQIVASVYLDPELDLEREKAAICKFRLVIQPPSD